MADIVWWEIETHDPEEFQRFHSAMWGWSFTPAFEGSELGAEYWVIRDGDSDVGGLQRAEQPVPASGSRVYIRVDDIEQTLARVVALGGSVARERVDLKTQWFALFRDPTGVLFGLWSSNGPRSGRD